MDDDNKRDGSAKYADRIAQELTDAFSRVSWPYGEEAEPVMTPPLARDILNDIELLDHEVVKYYLPRLMGVSIGEQPDTSLQGQMIHRLVELLDVDFSDTTGNNSPLKEARKDMFHSYTSDQAKAICSWLEFVKTAHHQTILDEQLSSAMRYWRAFVTPPPRG